MTRRLLGLAFVAILAAAVGLSVLVYQKAFVPATWVTLQADRIGLQLNQGADVKVRDVVVGTVRDIQSNGTSATLRLALNPDLTVFIPRNVQARLLPRTIFGERYVALVPPANAATEPIRDGDTITQDRTANAIELEQVLDDSLQLLQKVKVDKLAATLNAFAAALDGRGARLGNDIAQWDTYLAALNSEMPDLQADIALFAQDVSTFDDAAPDLLAFLRDAAVTANTIDQQSTQLHSFLVDATTAADTTRDFLDDHDDQLIRLGQLTEPLTKLLAAYAPTYPCVLGAIVGLQDRANRVFANGRMTVTQYAFLGTGYPSQHGYLPGDEPVFADQSRADCRSLGTLQNLPDTSDPRPAKPPQFMDGYQYGKSHTAAATATTSAAPVALLDPSIGLVGSPEETSLIKAIVAADTGTSADSVSDLAVLLYGPVLRSGVVNIG
jgi:phospholipid/cholesterol/gamma-HCH transport system substrate-binding protein